MVENFIHVIIIRVKINSSKQVLLAPMLIICGVILPKLGLYDKYWIKISKIGCDFKILENWS